MSTTTINQPEGLQRIAERFSSDPLFSRLTSKHPPTGIGQSTGVSTESSQEVVAGLLKAMNPFQIIARVLVDSSLTFGDQHCSRTIELTALAELANSCCIEQPEQVEFTWTKRSHRIREIARQYSETADADY